MAEYLSPGVYIQEINSDQSIQGVATNVPVFIGVCLAGPTQTPTFINGWDSFTSTFGSFGWNAYLPYAVYAFFSEGGGSCYVIRSSATAASGGPTGVPGTADVSPITFTATTAGDWITDWAVEVANDPSAATSSGAAGSESATFMINMLAPVPQTDSGNSNAGGTSGADTPTFSEQIITAYAAQNNLSPYTPASGDGTAYYVVETYTGFTTKSLAGTGNNDSSLETRINSSSLIAQAMVPASDSPTRPGNGVYTFSAADPVTWAFNDAIDLLDKINGYELAAMPDTVTSGTESDQLDQINLLLLSAEKLLNFFAVVDPPFGQSVQEVVDFKQGSGGSGQSLSSEYGAIYYPWIYIMNPMNSAKIPVPPSGAALGRYAYSDNTVGVWKAPAGITYGSLQIATNLNAVVTDSDQDMLNPAGINAIRSFVGYGITIWGGRTLSAISEWIYINVRRLFIYIEQSIYTSLQWVVFEPNNMQLWGQVTRDITAFLNPLWQQGALSGAKASEAYFVNCNATNNPPETQAKGQLIVDIGVAPVYPAEFVILRFTQKTLTSTSS